VRDIGRDRLRGIGKPEPVRGCLASWRSQRITGDHRIVYRIRGSGGEQQPEIVACRYHYAPRG
jgi:toxin YoeB